MCTLIDISIRTAYTYYQQTMKQRRKQLIKDLFRHIQIFPPSRISQATVLLPISDSISLFHALTNTLPAQAQNRSPQNTPNIAMTELQPGNVLIYPSTYLLDARKNFTTVYYLLKQPFIKSAKFIFVVRQSQTQQGKMRPLRDALINFFTIFKQVLDNDEMEELLKSCGMIIENATVPLQSYQYRLAGKEEDRRGLRQDSFITDQVERRKVVRLIYDNIIHDKRIIVNQPGSNSIKQKFNGLVNKLDYCELPSKLQPNIRLQTNYADYRSQRIWQDWKLYFERLWNHLQKLVFMDDTVRQHQQQLFFSDKELNQHRPKSQHRERAFSLLQNKQMIKIDSQSSQRLLSFINNFLKIIHSLYQQTQIQKIQANKILVQNILQAMYASGYLSLHKHQQFMQHYFILNRCLTLPLNGDNNLFEMYQFGDLIRRPQIFNQKMSIMLQQLLRIVQNDVDVYNEQYPYTKIINQIQQFFTNVQLLKQRTTQCHFMSPRSYKKLKKFQALMAYMIAKNTKARHSNHHQQMQQWHQFTKFASQSPHVPQKYKNQALEKLAQLLYTHRNYQIALKIYMILPQYVSYPYVSKYYQKQQRISPQYMKTLQPYQWDNMLNLHLDKYCGFLLKLGLVQQVRKICLEGLRLARDQQEKEQFRRWYIKAGGIACLQIHQKFIDQVILQKQEKEVCISQQLLRQIQNAVR